MARRRRHRCFDLDGVRVQGDPDMPPEVREALQKAFAAARAQLEKTSPSPVDGEQEITDTERDEP